MKVKNPRRVRRRAGSAAATGFNHAAPVCMWPIAALFFIGTAHAADTDGDGITDLEEGQVNGGRPLSVIFNRGFESPVLSGGFRIDPAADVANWSTTSACDCIEIWTDGYNGVPSKQGDQFIELNAHSASDIFQQMALPSEVQTLEYSFSHRGRNAVDTMEVYIGVDSAGKTLVETVSTGSTSWATYSGQWHKPEGAESFYIEFKSVGGGSVGNFIDDVLVNGVSLDTDDDGTPDYLDNDSDDDGIADSIELTVDDDSDGIPDFQDPDATGAGTLDNDGDGLTNLTEATITLTDPDNTDTDGDGLRDGDEVNTHSTDPTMADTDADGLEDGLEVNTVLSDPTLADTDGDQLIDGDEFNTHNTDPTIVDTDGDGLDDGNEVNVTQTDPQLADTDADGLSDGAEVNTHATDPNNPDSDGGGANDGNEVLTGSDPSVPGDDVVELDTDDDGIPDVIEGMEDQDKDGVPNYRDLDSDNDGIADIIEAGGVDANNDGTVDNLNDENNDGLDDAIAAKPLPVNDTDSDGLPDHLDVDSDQDGLADILEAGGTDGDGNGTVDDFTDTDGNGMDDSVSASPLPVPDTDGDTVPDYLDLDSDNDGKSDLIESGGTDVNGDGLVDLFLDDDADGIPNQADVSSTQGTDTDGDGIDDVADVDQTGGADINGNGIDDTFDADPDGDGRGSVLANDGSAGYPDEDNDGTPDFLDTNGATVITGLSGSAAGCTLHAGAGSRVDPLLPMTLLLMLLLMNSRRRLK